MNEKIVSIKTLQYLVESFPDILSGHFKIERFNSKKNIVFNIKFDEALHKDIIVKIFMTQNANNEYNTLLKFREQEQFVPKIIDYQKPYLLLEKIEGHNLCDYINDNLKDSKELSDLNQKARERLELSIHMLADWLSRIHQKNIILNKEFSDFTVLNKGDARLRDFIINFKKGKIYGLDFEDSYEGNHIDDIAWICCALLDTNPGIFEMKVPTHKIELINIFLKEYYKKNVHFKFDFDYFTNQLIENLNTVIERRNINLGIISKESILKKLAGGIK